MSNTPDKIELSTHKVTETMALALHMEVRKLEAENRELWRMLERLEWIDGHHVDFKCPICGEPRYEAGHAPTCQLSALLSRKPKHL